MIRGGTPPIDGMTVRELHREFDRGLFDRMYRELLEPAFPRGELEPAEPLASRLAAPEQPGSLAAVALDGDGELLAGVVADHDRECGVLLISYLAVRPDARRQGVGTYLMREVASRWYEGTLLTLAEVHDPRPWSARGDNSAVKRLAFFGRLGAVLLRTPFVQPSLHPGAERVGGFLLAALHVDPDVAEEGGVSSDLVARFVRRYYASAEGERAEDGELASLLAGIEASETVELLPVGEYERIPLP